MLNYEGWDKPVTCLHQNKAVAFDRGHGPLEEWPLHIAVINL